MKRRIIVASSVIIVLLAAYFPSRIFVPSNYRGNLDIIALFVFVYNGVYLLFGIPRLIVYSIYGLFIIPILYFAPEQYHLLLIFISTVIIVLNPLAELEYFLDKNLKDNVTKSFDFKPLGKYKTFRQYQEDMKTHYHLPQTQKLYTKPFYLYLRTTTLIALFAMLVFLLLYSSSDIIITTGFDVKSITIISLALLIAIALIVLYKKGFNSMFRVFKVGVLPPIIFVFSYLDFNLTAKGITLGILSSGLIAVIITEIISHYSRVIYSSYHYFDPSTNEDVWANALYEPYIYNSIKKETVLFKFELPEELFKKQFNTLLSSTNFFKTIITAYSLKRGIVHLYIEYYSLKDIKRVERSIKKIYNVELTKTTITDEKYYETKFLHNHEYIISRAIKLSNLLIELEIKEPVIISVSMHFKNKEQANALTTNYKVQYLEEKQEYCLVECSIKVENFDYLIETHLRNLLLEMLINGGTFVRVMVYY